MENTRLSSMIKCDFSIAENLANMTFYNKIGRLIQERVSLLFRLINNYENLDIDEYYYRLSTERRNLFFSFETSKITFDIKNVEAIIKNSCSNINLITNHIPVKL